MLVGILFSVVHSPIFSYAVIALVSLFGVVSTAVMWNSNGYRTRRQLKGLRQYGSPKGNMADQYDSKFKAAETASTNGPIEVKSLYIHPIKSCGFIEVDHALLTKTGFLYDRCFALATESFIPGDGKMKEWRFISQRTKPIMSQIHTELWFPSEHGRPQPDLLHPRGCMVIRFKDPDVPSWTESCASFFDTWSWNASPHVTFVIPLHPTPAQVKEGRIQMRKFGIHVREAEGLDLRNIPSVAAALPKLMRFLKVSKGQDFTLLRCTSETLCRTTKNLAPLKNIGTPAVHGYTDQQPVNINSLSSIHAISELLPPENQPLDALRFRANVWFTGAPAYDEENWKRCRIVPKRAPSGSRSNIAPTLSVVCRTSRCTMPNVNLNTGSFDADHPAPGKKKGKPQPSTTLVEYRTVEDGNKAALGYSGMHCVPEDQDIESAKEQKKGLYIEVGDVIEVLERGTHLYGSTGNDY